MSIFLGLLKLVSVMLTNSKIVRDFAAVTDESTQNHLLEKSK